jgi:hypothetical protein
MMRAVSAMRRPPVFLWSTIWAAGLTYLLATPLATGPSLAQAPATANSNSFVPASGSQVEMDGSIMNEAPFDLITLTQEAGGESVRVFPIDFPSRRVPTNPDTSKPLEVTLTTYPDRKYEVMWKDIARIETYETLVLKEANRYMEAKDFGAAFEHLNYLYTRHPGTPGLERLLEKFLFECAVDLFKQKRLPHTLAVLEELRKTFPSVESKKVLDAISAVTNQMLQAMVDQGDLQSARALLNRLATDYQATPLDSVSKWNRSFADQGEMLRVQATELKQAKRYREARDACQRLLYLYPETKGVREMLKELDQVHPLVRVGVFQSSPKPDASSLLDWPARRVGGLVARPLVEMRGIGPEGGNYRFVMGSMQTSDDLQELRLSFAKRNLDQGIIPHEIGQWMSERATPGQAQYRADFASVFRDASVTNSDSLLVRFRHPHVLPHALLQWPLSELQGTVPSQWSSYEPTESQENRTWFRWIGNTPQPNQPIEIVERRYEGSQQAIQDLLSGELDMIDQLYPADLKLLARQKGVVIESYALPTVHLLVPRSEHPYLKSTEFRRALLYGCNRESILKGEILGGAPSELCQLISGPFPAGASANDPIAYAYDESIAPYAYDSRLAKLLLTMAQHQLHASAEKKKQPKPELTSLKLGVPDLEAARVAGQSMIQQWSMIGIPVEMIVLRQGLSPPEALDVDLLYVAAAVWEPAVDAQRLLGADSIAASSDPFVILALEKLRKAKSWRDVRTELRALHGLVNYHLPVLPLWQITDSVAYRSALKGVSKKPVALYQDVEKWRVQSE